MDFTSLSRILLLILLLLNSLCLEVSTSDPGRRYAFVTDVPRSALRSGRDGQHGSGNHTTPVHWLLHHHRCLCMSSHTASHAFDHYTFVHNALPLKQHQSTELTHVTALLDLIHTKEGILFTDVFTIFPNSWADSLMYSIEEWSIIPRNVDATIPTGKVSTDRLASIIISPQFSLFNPTVFIRNTYKGIRFVSLWKNWLSHCLESRSTIFPRCPKPLRFSLILTILQSKGDANFDTEPDLQLRSMFVHKDRTLVDGATSNATDNKKENENYFNNLFEELAACLSRIKHENDELRTQADHQGNDNGDFNDSATIFHTLIPSAFSPYHGPSTNFPEDSHLHSELLLTVDTGLTSLRSSPAASAFQENISIIHISPIPSTRRHNYLRIERNVTFQRLQLSLSVMKKCNYKLSSSRSNYAGEGRRDYGDFMSDSTDNLDEFCTSFKGSTDGTTSSTSMNGSVNSSKFSDQGGNNHSLQINHITKGSISSTDSDFGDTFAGLTDLDMEYVYSDDYMGEKQVSGGRNSPLIINEGQIVVDGSIEIEKGGDSSPLEQINFTVADTIKSKTIMETLVHNYYDFISFVLRWCTIFLLVAILLVFFSLPLISFGTRISSQSSSSLAPSIAYAYDEGRKNPIKSLLTVTGEGHAFHQEMYATAEVAELQGRSHSERTKAEVTREILDPMR